MKVVIVGGSHAGIACARRARKNYPDAEIVLYEKQKQLGFIAQSIPWYLMGREDLLEHATYTTVEELQAQGITTFTETTVRTIDTKQKQLFITKINSQNIEAISYDKLVLATGSYPLLPMFSAENQERVIVIKNMEDAQRVKALFETAKKVIVVGGGFIGVEIARIFATRQIGVALIQPHHYLLDRYLDEPAARCIEDNLQREGVQLHLSTFPIDIRQENGQLHLYTDQYDKIEADAIIYSVGFRPNSFLLANQVILGDMGAIEVDEYMRSSQPDVFAIGDCATSKVAHLKENKYLPHASEAIRQGQIAALNLVAPRQKIRPTQGTYSMNLEEHTVCATGLTRKKAQEAGFDCDQVHYKNASLTGKSYTNIWLTYEKGSHKILGAQVEGTTVGIASYADLFSLAIQNDLRTEDLEFSDFYFKHGYKNPEGMINTLAELVRDKDPLI